MMSSSSYDADYELSSNPVNPASTAQDVVNFLCLDMASKSIWRTSKRILCPAWPALLTIPTAVFDLVELTSILLIPHLRKTGADDDHAQVLVGEVLKMIMLDVTGSTEPVRLDRKMMINIMKTYGEDDVPISDGG
ncbi:hypothetical protein MHU86_13450 [Fragilaria crotonensis]|nr:hypothetical protein MHU86_13450 [Fragilaria crotonensis]